MIVGHVLYNRYMRLFLNKRRVYLGIAVLFALLVHTAGCFMLLTNIESIKKVLFFEISIDWLFKPEPEPEIIDLNTTELPNQISERFGRADYAVVLIDTTGRYKLAINGDEQFTAASTYKLYVAYSMISSVEGGRWSWDSAFAGTTLSDCFEQMIVKSDNFCPETWMSTVSYEAVTEQMRSLGLHSTTLRFDGMTTTASDLAHFLELVYQKNDSMMSQQSRKRLLDAMSRQVFREGIPEGVGWETYVANKVGFLGTLLHDAGIVFNPKGDYILVILTDNSSWPAIADVTAMIADKIEN